MRRRKKKSSRTQNELEKNPLPLNIPESFFFDFKEHQDLSFSKKGNETAKLEEAAEDAEVDVFLKAFYKDFPQKELKVQNAMNDTFRPEFLNRIDNVIVFEDLNPYDLATILEILSNKYRAKLKGINKNFSFYLTPHYKEFIMRFGFQMGFGARPLIRTFNRFVEMPVATFLERVDTAKFEKHRILLVFDIKPRSLVAPKPIKEDIEMDAIVYPQIDDKNPFYEWKKD
uniref:Clp protease ATP binding subunit n=2 Tax=Chromera velia TaxID=505693 RepID=D9IXI5_9ALVE|nr:Clp protease ATP binding subunit [Chromera velia]ADJ66513.2 Clp protease ATP binding subunit [Chromera velia]